MATIALTVVGNVLLPGGLGAFLGAQLGGFIDRQFLFPLIFNEGDENIQGPRLDDLKVQTASEGSLIYLCMGPETRVAGTVFWYPNLVEKQHTERGPGKGGGGGGGSRTVFTYFANAAIGICAGPIVRLRKIWADDKVIYTNDGVDEVFDDRYLSLSIHLGTPTQLEDPLIQSFEDDPDVVTPAYRHLAYVVFEELALADWGNRLPNITFLVEADAEPFTVGDAIVKVIAATNSPASIGLSTTGVDKELRGMAVPGPTQTARVLEALMLYGDVALKESQGKLTFTPRGQEVKIAALESDLAAIEEGGQSASKIVITDMPDVALPNEFNIGYFDVNQKYERGSQRQRRQGQITTDVVRTLELPISMTALTAREVAKRRLWAPWIERQVATIQLPPRYVDIEEGDLVTFVSDAQAYEMRVSRMGRGNNFLRIVQGPLLGVRDFVYDATSEDPDRPEPPPYQAPATTLFVLDMSALRDQDTIVPGYYVGMCATDPSAQWISGQVFISPDDVTYASLLFIGGEATILKTTVLFASPLRPGFYWDRNNVMEVEMLHGELSSATELETLNGANRLLFEQIGLAVEIIGFQNAVAQPDGPNGEKRYHLSKLLRSLRGSGSGVKGAGTKAMLLDPANMHFIEHNASEIGSTRFWKGVAYQGDVAATVPYTEALDGTTRQNFGVTHARAQDGPRVFPSPLPAGDWRVSWTRVTRSLAKLFQEGTDVPLVDGPPDVYEIDIRVPPADTVRTVVVTDLDFFIYTAAQQVTDFGSTQDLVRFTIFHLTPLTGRAPDGRGSAVITGNR